MEPGVPRRETTSERASAAGPRRRPALGVGVDVEPDGPGAQFRITYAPTEYGTDLVGRLVIVTDENTWVFEVVGTIPEYAPPKGGAKVTTRLDPGDEGGAAGGAEETNGEHRAAEHQEGVLHVEAAAEPHDGRQRKVTEGERGARRRETRISCVF